MIEKTYRRGDVFWWYCPDHNRVHIQEGSRPCVIVSNDLCNESSGVVTIVPFTTKVKKPYPQQVPVVFEGSISIALADQLTSVPKAELGHKIGRLTSWQMKQIDGAMMVQLGLYSDIQDIKSDGLNEDSSTLRKRKRIVPRTEET